MFNFLLDSLKSVPKIIYIVLIICFGIVIYVGQLMNNGMTADEIFGPPEQPVQENIRFEGGKIRPMTILKGEDKDKECLECHIDKPGFPLKQWVKDKYMGELK